MVGRVSGEEREGEGICWEMKEVLLDNGKLLPKAVTAKGRGGWHVDFATHWSH
jgi:hypothetical protein